jgi:aspartyl protease family protein
LRTLTIIAVVYISISGCDHPETKKYDRNRNTYKEAANEDRSETKFNSIEPVVSDNDAAIVEKNVLPMEIESGVRYVWIEVNGIRLRFIFDTGASSICISPAEATVLIRQSTLNKEDILDVEYFQDATGRISEGTKINLRDVKIGSMVLENVKATVIDNVNAPLLLGQTVLERFGRIEIDNTNNEIIFK